jgi:hypothetical protein
MEFTYTVELWDDGGDNVERAARQPGERGEERPTDVFVARRRLIHDSAELRLDPLRRFGGFPAVTTIRCASTTARSATTSAITSPISVVTLRRPCRRRSITATCRRCSNAATIEPATGTIGPRNRRSLGDLALQFCGQQRQARNANATDCMFCSFNDPPVVGKHPHATQS